MNILLVSNSDICRSRMAQKILSSFGYGTKIFTSGVLPGRVVPSSVVGVMEQNGYDCSRKKASDVDIYCHQPWDYVITLCEEAKEVEGDFNKEVKNWKIFLLMTRFSIFMRMKQNWNIVFPNFMKRCIVNYMSFIGTN